MPVNVRSPVTLSGANVLLGVVLKPNASVALVPALVTEAQVHCLVLSVTATPRVQPAVLFTVTALLGHPPPVTPINVPPLMVVAPL